MTHDLRLRRFGAAALVALLAACGQGGDDAAAPTDEDAAPAAAPAEEPEAAAPAPTPGEIMDEVLAGDWRGDDSARDVWRNPKETLAFFGLEPGMTVVEIWPGGGWYTKVIAPFLARTDGTYIAAGFDPSADSEFVQNALKRYRETYVDRPDIYGTIEMSALSADSGPIAPAGSVDMVLSFRNVHNWMSGEFAEKAVDDFYAALKPGGVLGIVEHRAPEEGEQDPKAPSGYVQQAYVIALAEAAGFELVEASEINANPNDTKDHPFGVWTLPPTKRSAGFGAEPDPDFDGAPYEAIGESDRMTLKFRKPADAGE